VRRLPTWAWELAAVATLLLVVGSTEGWRGVVGAIAVSLAFAHAQVADRLREKEAARATPEVECHRWLDRYWTAKEVAWVAYFATAGAWTALAGCGVFLAYPLWRRWYRPPAPPDTTQPRETTPETSAGRSA
jgi:hypothetical protein